MNEIELTPYLSQLFLTHIRNIEQSKIEMNKDLKILFESKGLQMPELFNFEIKDNKLIYKKSNENIEKSI